MEVARERKKGGGDTGRTQTEETQKQTARLCLVQGCELKRERGEECKGRRTMRCCVSLRGAHLRLLVHSAWCIPDQFAEEEASNITLDLWNSQRGRAAPGQDLASKRLNNEKKKLV